jgi:hypothetical protein
LTPSSIGADKPSFANGMGIICGEGREKSMQDLAQENPEFF